MSFYKGQCFANAERLVASQRGRKLLRARQIIVERVIGEAMKIRLLNRCRYRRLYRFRIQLFFVATAAKIKHLLREEKGTSETRNSTQIALLSLC